MWEAFIGRGKAYTLEDMDDRAIADYGQAIRIKPDCGEAYCRRAEALIACNHEAAAIDDASEAIRLSTRNWEAYALRGDAFMSLREYDKALFDFSRAIERAPPGDSLARCHRSRGLTFWLCDNNPEAVSDFTKSLEMAPGNGVVAYYRGRAYFDASMYREAVLDLERWLGQGASENTRADAAHRLEKARQALKWHAPSSGPGRASSAPADAIGGFLRGAWNLISGKELCPNCNTRETKRLSSEIVESWQEWQTVWESGQSRGPAPFNVYISAEEHNCNVCGRQWTVDVRRDVRA